MAVKARNRFKQPRVVGTAQISSGCCVGMIKPLLHIAMTMPPPKQSGSVKRVDMLAKATPTSGDEPGQSKPCGLNQPLISRTATISLRPYIARRFWSLLASSSVRVQANP